MQAADLYGGEEVSTAANNCKLKVAELSASLERYPLAIEVFEEVAKASVSNNLLRFSVKGYLLNAGLCRLCSQEPVGVKNALERYEGAFYKLVPIRLRWRGGRRSLRTFPGASLRPHLAFNPRPRRLSTSTDAFQLHSDGTKTWTRRFRRPESTRCWRTCRPRRRKGTRRSSRRSSRSTTP